MFDFNDFVRVKRLLLEKAEQPERTQFFISTPPRRENTRYIVTADGVIDANGEVMA